MIIDVDDLNFSRRCSIVSRVPIRRFAIFQRFWDHHVAFDFDAFIAVVVVVAAAAAAVWWSAAGHDFIVQGSLPNDLPGS